MKNFASLRISDRELRLARLAGLILLLALFFVHAHLPALRELCASMAQRRGLLREKVEMGALLQHTSAIRHEYDQVEVWTLSTRTKAEETAAILKEIESLARPLRLRILSVKPLALKKGDLLAEHRVRIDSEGRLADVVRFLVAIQNAQSLLKTTEIRLAAKAKPEDWLKMSVVVARLSSKKDET